MPITVAAFASITFNGKPNHHLFACCPGSASLAGRACYNFWNARHLSSINQPPGDQHQRSLTKPRLYRYLYFCVLGTCSLIYGLIWCIYPYILLTFWPMEDTTPWYTFVGFRTNMERYKVIHYWSQDILDQVKSRETRALIGVIFTPSFAAFHFCIYFDLGIELHKTYSEWRPGVIVHMKRMRVPFLIDLLVNTVNYCWRRRSRADPNNFTPFLTHDIMMEDLTAVPDTTNGAVGVGKRLPPVRVPPPPPAPESEGSPAVVYILPLVPYFWSRPSMILSPFFILPLVTKGLIS
ncbi:hypothetical protein FRC14_006422 [Serendipita sp. 396]|nr:hypothetical protein FRC14_006422 [Serendipita sp. 396]